MAGNGGDVSGTGKSADAGRGGLGLERLTVTPHNGTHMDAPGTTAQPPTAANRRLASMSCRWSGACAPASGWIFAMSPTGDPAAGGSAARAGADRLSPVAAGYRVNQYRRRRPLRPAGLSAARLRHWPGGNAVAAGAGVRVVGTDAWSWDAPFHFTRERFQASGDAGLIWEGHKAGRRSPMGKWRS